MSLGSETILEPQFKIPQLQRLQPNALISTRQMGIGSEPIVEPQNEIPRLRRLQPSALIAAIGEGGLNPWFEGVRRQIVEYASLGANWDSYGADPPKFELLDSALQLLACLASSTAIPEPYVCPTRSGGVQFEWERGSRYFEVEVVGRFAAEYYFSDTDERSVATGEVFDGELLDPIVEFIHKVEAAAS